MAYPMEQVHVLNYVDHQASGDAPLRPRYTFPYKLWMILNNRLSTTHRIVWWSDDGKEVIADPDRFEHFVMSTYPDFVRIPSFANFRRQMRWYNFSWEVDDFGYFHFKNPDYQRGREDLLQKVLTKRCNSKRSEVRTVTEIRGYHRRPGRPRKLEYDMEFGEPPCTVQFDPNYSVERIYSDGLKSTVSTQTAFTMSPFGTDYIGTVNDSAHYYDFYSIDFGAHHHHHHHQQQQPQPQQHVQQPPQPLQNHNPVSYYTTYSAIPVFNISPPANAVDGSETVASDAMAGIVTPISLTSRSQSTEAVEVLNVFSPGELNQAIVSSDVTSPENLCLDGYPKTVVMENATTECPSKVEVVVGNADDDTDVDANAHEDAQDSATDDERETLTNL